MPARKLTRFALLISIGVSLNWLEYQLLVIPVPGARLGLANIVSILGLSMFGFKTGFALVLIRVIASSIITGRFMNIGFFMSMGGAIASFIFMALFIRKVTPSRTLVLVASTGGAILHNIAQLLIFGAMLGNLSILYYLPALLLVGIPGGIMVGLISHRILEYDYLRRDYARFDLPVSKENDI